MRKILIKKIFLGGTCNNSTWRDALIPMLNIDYFNPVVEDWTPKDQEIEILERETCDYCLYAISPKMKGVYSIAEVIEDSNKRPEKTLFIFFSTDNVDSFNGDQLKSLTAVGDMVKRNGGKVFSNLEEIAEYVNN